MSEKKEKTLDVLSLGWGVQSFTILAMISKGIIEKPDYIIHAETGYETTETKEFVERQKEWLEKTGINIITTKDDAPIIHKNGKDVFIPAYSDYGKGGMIMRACTVLWKVAPIKRKIREIIKDENIKFGHKIVRLWMGITTDESRRAKPYRTKYIESKFPLLEMGFSRDDCIQWLEKNGFEVPPKSSCIFCPYRSEENWRKIQKNEKDWQFAISVDEKIRNIKKDYSLYLHYTLKPLKDVDFYKPNRYRKGK